MKRMTNEIYDDGRMMQLARKRNEIESIETRGIGGINSSGLRDGSNRDGSHSQN